ncbi:hypothetical protein LTR28_012808, partial [Elasticomyces elasticus]
RCQRWRRSYRGRHEPEQPPLFREAPRGRVANGQAGFGLYAASPTTSRPGRVGAPGGTVWKVHWSSRWSNSERERDIEREESQGRGREERTQRPTPSLTELGGLTTADPTRASRVTRQGVFREWNVREAQAGQKKALNRSEKDGHRKE